MLAVYDKKNWPFDQWISIRLFKIRHLTLETLCRIHILLVHGEISNQSSFLMKFKSYKSAFFKNYINVYADMRYSVPFTNKIQTHYPIPISHINNIKMFRRCIDLLKNKKTSITNFTQGKTHLPECPAFFVHLNIFLDYISLEAYIHILGFS